MAPILFNGLLAKYSANPNQFIHTIAIKSLNGVFVNLDKDLINSSKLSGISSVIEFDSLETEDELDELN